MWCIPPRWLAFALLAIGLFGSWAAISKAAAESAPPGQNQVLFTLGFLPIALGAGFWARRMWPSPDRTGLALAALTGLIGALGNLALFVSLNLGGKSAVLSPLMAFYPLVT